MNRAFLLLSGIVLLPSCTMAPAYEPKSASALGVPDQWSVPATPDRADLTRWWLSFDDPVLGQLVEQAAQSNLDLAQATARLRQAREALVVSRSSLLPSASGSAGYRRTEPLRGGDRTTTLPDGSVVTVGDGGTDSFSLGLDASYQLDLFGGVRSSVAASRAQYEGAGFDYATVLLSVQSEVARNYVLARAYQAQIENARSSLAIQDDNLEIAGFRVQAGLASSLDAEQARASRAQTAASLPQIEQQYNAAVSRIGVLTGQAPGALKEMLAAPKPIPRGPEEIAAGIPADVLRQRPDVRAAERNLAATTAQIGVSRAQLFPALSIGGSLSAGATSLGSVLDTITGSLFASLSQLIFDGGRTSAQIRSAQAGAEGAFASYRSTVLTALEDVENALVALRTAGERERQFAIAFDAANTSALLARDQYRTGLTDFTTLNTQEASLISARNGLVQARADKATALIALYTSLGGGWDSTVTPTAPQ
ncbi:MULTISPECIES: efflux transporter outer membrane subunit [unclassified Sphingobium]|uniref:efflux transporter outer membrane subunit n=1 Tax=unclassified Sphingobium TaxID=2611147 RepID=UPI0022253298|nr:MULTISPECIES: efflux transporter outer membrane subunit [unclassified Sphingobium]MCW2412834.1 NodT family efflux transporter outer membrane factor (OMF) lipoprotein [Sphingobium sp. B8D3D]MCW2414868.1 NodT family efflux transporter outer membrane factor (OMF) lipoprotein [Sphingobium sp. B8D3A]